MDHVYENDGERNLLVICYIGNAMALKMGQSERLVLCVRLFPAGHSACTNSATREAQRTMNLNGIPMLKHSGTSRSNP
jgi:hypothetical protein